MLDFSLDRLVTALEFAAIMLALLIPIGYALHAYRRNKRRVAQGMQAKLVRAPLLESRRDLGSLLILPWIENRIELIALLEQAIQALPEEEREKFREQVKQIQERSKQQLDRSRVYLDLPESPLLTRSDLTDALRSERETARKEALEQQMITQERHAKEDDRRKKEQQREKREGLLINIALTVFSLVVGWILSAFVHLPW